MKQSVINQSVFLAKLALIFSAFAICGASAFTDTESVYVQSYQGRTDSPVPLKVETPVIGAQYVGETIQVVFTVTDNGAAKDVQVKSPVDNETKEKIVHAINLWEFKPLVKDGKNVATTVSLPIRIVE